MTEATTQAPTTTDSGKSEAVSDAVMENYINGKADTTIEGKGATFDDFASMEAARDEFFESRKGKKKDKAPEQKESTEEKQEVSTGKKTELEKTKEKTKEDMDVEPTVGIDPKKTEVKFFKGMDGDNAVDLNPDLKVKLKVDGKLQDVSLKDLADNFNGKVGWDKKINEGEKIRREAIKYKAQVDEQSAKIKRFIEVASTNPDQALYEAFEDAGANVDEFFSKRRETFLDTVYKLIDMSPEQRDNYFKDEENKFLRSRLDSNRKKGEQQVKHQAVRTQIEQVKQSKGLSDDEFSEAYDRLKAYGAKDLNVNVVAETALDLRAIKKTEKILGDIDESLLSENAIYTEVFDFVRRNAVDPNSSFSDQDILSVVKEILGKEAAHEVAQKVTPPGPKQVLKSHKEDSSAMFSDWDD